MRPDTEPDATKDRVVVHVDPSCPFAWITYRWLIEVAMEVPIDLTVELLSLSVVNEHRELDDWYRGFNDSAWAPATVMAAVTKLHDAHRARAFYDAFGQRFHVEHGTSDDVTVDSSPSTHWVVRPWINLLFVSVTRMTSVSSRSTRHAPDASPSQAL